MNRLINVYSIRLAGGINRSLGLMNGSFASWLVHDVHLEFSNYIYLIGFMLKFFSPCESNLVSSFFLTFISDQRCSTRETSRYALCYNVYLAVRYDIAQLVGTYVDCLILNIYLFIIKLLTDNITLIMTYLVFFFVLLVLLCLGVVCIIRITYLMNT